MPCVELPVIYSFNYTCFSQPELECKARKTLSTFLGFVHQTFDGLLENGRALQEIYSDCITSFPNGKQLFNAWLASEDFGASRYIAQSAIEIYAWFAKLSTRVQHLVRQNVQKWSVSALRQLTKVSTDLVKELVGTGKKTAAQIKAVKDISTPSIPEAPIFAPGVRVVVVNNDEGWNGYKGIITSKWEEDGTESWWVLLDYAVSQGLNRRNLFKATQIKPEAIEITSKLASKEMFTPSEVEQKIAEALLKKDKEKAEEEMARFVEIRDAALKNAAEEIQAAKQQAQKMAQAQEQLLKQLDEKERELEKVRSLQTRNQQLEKRVTDLEKALEEANINAWDNTFTNQAAKVVNSELEKTITPLMSEIERLQNLVQTQQKEIVLLNESSISKIKVKDSEEQIIAEFGEIGERFGWDGWSRRGYRAASGMLHTGINAISEFIHDLTQEYKNELETLF